MIDMKMIVRWFSFKFSKEAFISNCGCRTWKTREDKVDWDLCKYHKETLSPIAWLRWVNNLTNWIV